MRKTEMSKGQAAARKLVADTLKAAGWSGTTMNRQFEEGLWTNYEASFEHDGAGGMTLTLNYNAKQSRLELSLYGRSGKGLDLVIECGEKWREVLEVIVGFQDEVSAKNYKQHVRELVAVCPDTFAAMGAEGDKLVRVTDKEAKLA
jgi:hypothetical protein